MRQRNDEQSSLIGFVTLSGNPPPEKLLPLDPQCSKLHEGVAPPTTKFYLLGEHGGLADVFVYIKDAKVQGDTHLQKPKLLIDQVACEYLPYMVGAQVGQEILVRNSDPALHNVHVIPSQRGNLESNFAQLPRSKDLKLVFNKPETFVKLKCDVHQWMFAWIAVVEHPFFAVTDKKGKFAINGLPPGEYTVEAVHRKAGTQQFQLSLEQGKETTLEFSFSVPEPKPMALDSGAARATGL
ncbi:MAG: carboxypeptidase regulatory-like domain-containing protein [Verrucomicrobiales bacterium]